MFNIFLRLFHTISQGRVSGLKSSLIFFTIICTDEPGFSKLFENCKNVYHWQMFTIYHVIYAMIANFGKQQKVY